MNHCRRCDSDYEKPGTCNCFAEKPAQQAAPSFVPWAQMWTTCGRCGTVHTGAHICYALPTITTTPWDGTTWYFVADPLAPPNYTGIAWPNGVHPPA